MNRLRYSDFRFDQRIGGQLDVDLARDAAPMAAYDYRNNREFFASMAQA